MRIQRQSFRHLAVIIILTLLIFLMDFHVSSNIAIPIFYTVVIVLVISYQRTWALLLTASICSALTLSRTFPDLGVEAPQSTWENRVISLCMIWLATMIGFLCLRQSRFKNELQIQLRSFFESCSLAVSIAESPRKFDWLNHQFKMLSGSANQVLDNVTLNAEIQKLTANKSKVNYRELEWHSTPLINDANQVVANLYLGIDIIEPGSPQTSLNTNSVDQISESFQIDADSKQDIPEEKQIEHEQKTVICRTHDILDTLIIFVGVYSIDGIILEANQSLLDAVKLKKSDIIGKIFWKTELWSYSVEVQQRLKQAMHRATAGETVRFDTQVKLADEKKMSLDITFSPLYDAEGNIIQIISSAVDISDRLITEKELIKKNEQLQAMLKAIPDLIFHIKNDGTIAGYESGANKNSILPTEQFLNKKVQDILPKHVVQKYEAAFLKLSKTKQTTSFDYRLKVNEQNRWFQAHLHPYLADELVVVIQDINDQKNIDIQTKNTHARLFESQRLAHVGSWEWNIQDDTVWWSEEVYRIFDLNASQFQPNYEAFLQIVHPDDRELVNQVVTNTLQNDSPFSIEHRIIRSDGEVRHVYQQAALKKNTDGETLLLYGTVQDVTERYEANRMAQEYRDELAHASRLAVMGELAAGISHELNQPLTAISNYSSSMKILLEQGQDVTELLSKIEAQSLRSGEIVRRLKLLAGKRKQQSFLFNIHTSIQSALQLINYELRLRQIQVKITSDKKFATVYADRVQIEQVLVNLFKNAAEAMEETTLPRVLTITLSSADDSMILISVTDTGKGIPAQFVDRLFTPFTTSKKEGLGIGLSLSRSLIEASGGKMWFSPNKSRGTTFYISLPGSQSQTEIDFS
ncbi:Sensor protein FixL [Gimesia aquarii]|uniref:histidine kinase n=2 Tax=Gimesia aquarii TaxID=2527964 RepID=A0A517WZ20_9PLAN|nr:Sensor protein FixL [Gimesia aquarii]